jgi:hypothetical protein
MPKPFCPPPTLPITYGILAPPLTRLQTDDAGKQFPFMDRAVNRLNSIEIAGVIREISKHIANRTIKRYPLF